MAEPIPGWLADQFEHWRPHLASVAYAMLGSVSEAEDAVQQAWLRLDRSDADAIVDLRAWLTTVVGRICLDMLRARKARPVDYIGAWLPEPLVEEPAADGPEQQALMADSVGMALLVVLESLSPAERLAFVLHDVFDMRFDEVGQIIGRTELATRQLASRARRRVRGAPRPDPDLGVQRRAVSAFLAAARNGDFEALLQVLAPDVVLHFDLGPGREPLPTLAGAGVVAGHVTRSAPRFVAHARPAVVNGAAGLLFGTRDEPISVLSFTVAGGRIVELDMVSDPAKLRHLAIQR
ncbi:MAG TPA: RNA polymerase sigma factor SigJ [Streptosporangiaceae bacterium]|nr:RNA polymerase sigma factor SigJ [Streptosporangiaceae bacterium]